VKKALRHHRRTRKSNRKKKGGKKKKGERGKIRETQTLALHSHLASPPKKFNPPHTMYKTIGPKLG
jgi:hypothetical protein